MPLLTLAGLLLAGGRAGGERVEASGIVRYCESHLRHLLRKNCTGRHEPEAQSRSLMAQRCRRRDEILLPLCLNQSERGKQHFPLYYRL